jgi:8-oxo-dGTP pyrophosphatase MutT (NUDIX family)
VLREQIRDEVAALRPLDAIEAGHREQVLAWIASGAELCCLAKPATPPMHLVSYFVVVDKSQQRLLLVEHRNAGLWLPPGGHVEPGEHPRETVAREFREELGFDLDEPVGAPLFITATKTVGLTAGHTDVSLWYLVRVHSTQGIVFDEAEFASVRWFDLDALPLAHSDPHLARFVAKLQGQAAVASPLPC